MKVGSLERLFVFTVYFFWLLAENVAFIRGKFYKLCIIYNFNVKLRRINVIELQNIVVHTENTRVYIR